MSQKIFAIGDVHGRKDLLDDLYFTINQNSDDKFVFLGDLIDRGPQSCEVIDTVMGMMHNYSNSVFCVLGNHERLCLNACLRASIEDEILWQINGGDATKASYPTAKVFQEHLEWMLRLPLYHKEQGFFFSHAPVPRESFRDPHMKGKEYSEQELTWTYNRDEFGVAKDFKDGTVGVCGHIHMLHRGVMAPRFYPHYIYADSGCGCSSNAPLVAVEVTTRETYWAWPEGVDEETRNRIEKQTYIVAKRSLGESA